MNNKEDILNTLFSLQRFGIKPGLERTLHLSEYIGNPHLQFPSIHVAGTNGKGSVCSMLASILMEAGYRVGLYTSPHLVNFNERIRINHDEITDDEMVELAEKLLIGVEKWGCTFFEITSVMAFEYFAKNKVDIAIIETGMGGRFDSTNILTPLVSMITAIDFDHSEYLGNTLEDIAFEKAGIIKEGIPVVLAKYSDKVKEVFIDKAKDTNSDIFDCCGLTTFQNHKFNADFSQSFDLNYYGKTFKNIRLDIAGEHQLGNVTEVITAIDLIKGKFAISDESLYNGLANIKYNTCLRGRIEFYNLSRNSSQQNENMILLDTGHNPGAVKRLAETLHFHRPDIEEWNFVYGAMADKDIRTILQIIKPVCNNLILTRPKIERAIGLLRLKQITDEIGFKEVIIKEEVSEAIEFAIEQKQATVISGSFYLAGEAIPVLEKMLKVQS